LVERAAEQEEEEEEGQHSCQPQVYYYVCVVSYGLFRLMVAKGVKMNSDCDPAAVAVAAVTKSAYPRTDSSCLGRQV
jgi:hypothetical protein